MRVIVNSIPKSGTYLYARLLEQLGFTNLGVHLSSRFAHDFRGASQAEIIVNSGKYRIPVQISETIGWLRRAVCRRPSRLLARV